MIQAAFSGESNSDVAVVSACGHVDIGLKTSRKLLGTKKLIDLYYKNYNYHFKVSCSGCRPSPPSEFHISQTYDHWLS